MSKNYNRFLGIFFSIFWCTCCYGINTNTANNFIIMPTAEILAKRLDEIGLGYFAKTTNIALKLGDKKTTPSGVVLAITIAYDNFNDYLTQQNSISDEVKNIYTQMIYDMIMWPDALIEALLADSPSAIPKTKKLFNDLFKNTRMSSSTTDRQNNQNPQEESKVEL